MQWQGGPSSSWQQTMALTTTSAMTVAKAVEVTEATMAGCNDQNGSIRVNGSEPNDDKNDENNANTPYVGNGGDNMLPGHPDHGCRGLSGPVYEKRNVTRAQTTSGPWLVWIWREMKSMGEAKGRQKFSE